jgi:hypothetical protein
VCLVPTENRRNMAILRKSRKPYHFCFISYSGHYCAIVELSVFPCMKWATILASSISNENGDYLDTTGYMGAGRDVQNSSLNCFNVEKNRILGWYSDRAQRIAPVSDGMQMIKLAAFVAYESTRDDEFVIINVGDRFFVQHNRATAMNIETEEKQDRVTIAKRLEVDGSEMVAGLDPYREPMHFEFYSSASALVFKFANFSQKMSCSLVLASMGRHVRVRTSLPCLTR